MIKKNSYNWGIAIAFLLACNNSFAQVKLGDNLGTHSASKALVMNGNDINSVRVINAEGLVIGTASMVDNASIALQVNASDKAILLPRVNDLLNTTSPSIINPVEGMMVYDLATHKFYIRNNNAWATYLTTSLAEGRILVGDANSMPQPVAVSGDISLQSTGEMTVGNLKITNAKLANGSVDNSKLLADAVTTEKIANLAVTAAKVGSGAGVDKVLTTDNSGNNIWIDRSQFASTTLNSGQILLGNSANVATAIVPSGDVTISNAGVTAIGTGKVQTGMLAGNAVISSKILDANVTGAKLASDAVTSDKIKDLDVNTSDLANAAVTEVKIASDAVTTAKIANANVTSAKLANAPAGGDLFNKVLTTDASGNNTWVDKTKITLPAMTDKQVIVANGTTPAAVTMSGDASISNTGAITIAADAVNSAKIADGTITGTDIAAGTVTSANILDATIAAADIASDAVTTVKIANANVTSAKLANAPAGGDLFNKVLTTDASGVNTWADKTKITLPAMTDKQVIVANGTTPAAVTMSGDASISNTGAITIAADAVNSAKIADGTITGTDIAAGTVTSANILDATIAAADIASDAVTTGKILNGNVTEVKIASDAVTTAKIADANVTSAKLANAPAGGDLFNKVLTTDASGANTWADKTKITLPAMTDKQVIVANGTTPAAVTMSGDASISNTGAVTIATGAVNSAKILDGTITGTDIATGTVTSANILDATIAAADIASDAVTTGKILNGNVTEVKIASDAVTTAKIADANVTSAKLANAPAGGDLFNKVLTTDASGNNTWADKTKITLPAMTDNQVIVANGTTPAAVTMSGDASISNTGAVTIATGAVNSAKILDGTITGTDIATGTVTSANILDATIAAADIASSAITTSKIANANVTSAKLASAPAGGDLFNKVLTTDAAGVNTWADKTKITLPAMTDMQIIVANGTTPAAVTMSGDASISNTGVVTIATGAVNSAKIADGTVTGTDIATGTVTSDNILDATIAAVDIASNAVTTDKILNANVTVDKLGTAGVSDAGKIYTTDAAGKPVLASSLSAAKIANGTVSDTEYQTLDGVTSGIQSQFDAISVGLVPVGSVTAWFPNLFSSATLPANFVECNGQVISDAQSPLNGVTIPNLNGGSYLTGTTGTTGTSVGSNSLTLTMANLPNATVSGTSTAVSAGTPAGTISVASAGAHTHSITAVTSLYGDDLGNTNGGDGQANRVDETNSAGAHTHTATFTGTAMGTHTHNTTINVNGGVTQTAINNRPQSFTVRWIMRIK